MTLSELAAALEVAAPGAIFAQEAPQALVRYVVYHQYNYQTIHGDDAAAALFPRVQLDVYWQQPDDTLLEDVLIVLNYWRQPYELADITRDDERLLQRAIIQLTVV